MSCEVMEDMYHNDLPLIKASATFEEYIKNTERFLPKYRAEKEIEHHGDSPYIRKCFFTQKFNDNIGQMRKPVENAQETMLSQYFDSIEFHSYSKDVKSGSHFWPQTHTNEEPEPEIHHRTRKYFFNGTEDSRGAWYVKAKEPYSKIFRSYELIPWKEGALLIGNVDSIHKEWITIIKHLDILDKEPINLFL